MNKSPQFIDLMNLKISKILQEFNNTNKKGTILGYSLVEINRRISQLIIKNYYSGLLKALESEGHAQKIFLGRKGQVYKSDNVEQYFSLTIDRSLESLFSFFKLSLFYTILLFYRMIMSYFKSYKHQKYSILFYPSINDFNEIDSVESFLDYCRDGSIDILKVGTDHKIVVQERGMKESSDFVVFTSDAFLYLIKNSNFSIMDFLIYMRNMLTTSLLMINFCFNRKTETLLSRDLGLLPLIRLFERKLMIKDLILTNSSFYDQEIWLSSDSEKLFKTHMLWYSNNSIPLRYANVEGTYEHPATSFISIDNQWTWSKTHLEWLMKNTSAKIFHSVDPILFHLNSYRSKINLAFDIIIYDVTPVNMDWISENIHPDLDYYYKAENGIKFITDILNAVLIVEKQMSIKLRVGIKHKRKSTSLHDRVYLDFIDDIIFSGKASLVHERSSIYKLISECQISAVIPFSSPALVASHLNKPVFYLDPSERLCRNSSPDNRIPILYETQEIVSYLKNHIVKGVNF